MIEASETDRIYEGEELADEMMVFAGVTGSHLDQILFMMRKKGMKRIDYKAVLFVFFFFWFLLVFFFVFF